MINWTKINVDTTTDLQDAVLNATEYTEIHLLPGIHEYSDRVDTNKSIIYIDKSNIKIIFHPQSILKLADNTQDILEDVEINTNYFLQTGLNDIEARAVGGGTPQYNIVDALITINGTGSPNTFLVTQFQRHEAPNLTRDGNTIPIVAGEWVNIGADIEIRFLSATGHTNGDVWRIMTSAEAVYPIRVGDGFHTSPIKNVTIENPVINGNLSNNNRVHVGVAETSSGIGIFGRVENVNIKRAEIYDVERPIFIAGRHNGVFNNEGTTTGGESFDVEGVVMDNIYAHDNESAILWGHPSYRGYQRNIILRNSTVIRQSLGKHALEPNHRTEGFLVENCHLKGSDGQEPIHMWRSPKDGIIRGNTLEPNTIRDNAPTSWYRSSSVNVLIDNEDNVLSNPYRINKSVEPVNSQDSATSNMIAHYPLSNNSNEVLGIISGINGVDTDIIYESGEAKFNGSTSYITIPHNDIFSFTDGVNDFPFTIFMKVKFNDNSPTFLINKVTNNNEDREWSIANPSTSLISAQCRTNSSNFIDKRTESWNRTPGVWYSIAITYSGNKSASGLSFYIDGVEQNQTNFLGNYTGMINAGGNITIGKPGWVDSLFLNGSVKDLRFYNEEKTLSAVLDIENL